MPKDRNSNWSSDTSIRELIESVPDVGRVTRVKLEKSGYETVGDLQEVNVEKLSQVPRVGHKTAEKILDFVSNKKPSDSEEAEPQKDVQMNEIPLEILLEDVPKVGRVKRVYLRKSGYETVGDLRKATIDELADVTHIGHATAERILESVTNEEETLFETNSDEENVTSPDDRNPDHTVEAIMKDFEFD